ncbi:hypothetical protein FF38_07596 [Lucilia cuprina]|uniref:Uncharacterized protein n=1 Tax=Lucilia cuprina TaxID=7375 RepID=A0A0L0BZK8_LUCCU|nr:hypothetical protein FF38_07596 [Lucilia cuprina]
MTTFIEIISFHDVTVLMRILVVWKIDFSNCFKMLVLQTPPAVLLLCCSNNNDWKEFRIPETLLFLLFVFYFCYDSTSLKSGMPRNYMLLLLRYAGLSQAEGGRLFRESSELLQLLNIGKRSKSESSDDDNNTIAANPKKDEVEQMEKWRNRSEAKRFRFPEELTTKNNPKNRSQAILHSKGDNAKKYTPMTTTSAKSTPKGKI